MRNGLLSAMSAGVVLAAGMFFGHVRAAGPEFEVANITPAAQPTRSYSGREKFILA